MKKCPNAGKHCSDRKYIPKVGNSLQGRKLDRNYNPNYKNNVQKIIGNINAKTYLIWPHCKTRANINFPRLFWQCLAPIFPIMKSKCAFWIKAKSQPNWALKIVIRSSPRTYASLEQRKELMKSLFGSLLSLGIEEHLGNLTCWKLPLYI
jgi:hypothetical protein